MRAKYINEESIKTYLKIYKNFNEDYYNYTIIKGNELYQVHLVKDSKMQWRYVGEIDRNKYPIFGKLIERPDKTLIYIVQNVLKPTKMVETINFDRGQDPMKAMGIGIKTINKLKPLDLIKCKKRIKPKIINVPSYNFYIESGYYSVIKWIKITPNNVKLELSTYSVFPTHFKEADLKFSGNELITVTPEKFYEHFEIVQDELPWLKEAVNFERGQDPLKSMNIGKTTDPMYKLKKLLKSANIKSFIVDNDYSSINNGFWIAGSAQQLIPKDEDVIEQIVKEKYPDSLVMWSDLCFGTYHKLEIYFRKLSDANKFIKEWKEINESVNFERGQDPMKAMNIGKDRKIKEGDKFEAYDIKKRKMVKVEAYHDEELRSDEPGQSYRFVEIEIDGRNWFATFDFNHNCWVKGAFDAWGADLDEAVNFERGKNPFRAMEIGTITWNTLQPKDIIVQRNNRDDVFYLVVDIKRHGDKLTLTLAPFGTIAGLLRNLHLRLDPKFFASSVYTKKISTWTKRFKIIQPHELT